MFIVITVVVNESSVGAKHVCDRSIKKHIALLKELPCLNESRFL